MNVEEEANLEDELNMALRRLGLRDWTVVWYPSDLEEERGAVYPDYKLIVVHDEVREDAFKTLIHEFLEVRIKGVIRPYMATETALLKALEKE